jgi:hypothetical protein
MTIYAATIKKLYPGIWNLYQENEKYVKSAKDITDVAKCNVMVQFIDGTDWNAHCASLGKFLMVDSDNIPQVYMYA